MLFKVEVIEGFNEVIPIEVSINSEHLTKYQFAGDPKLLWESALNAQPVFVVVGKTYAVRIFWVICERSAEGISGKYCVVIDLLRNPALRERHGLTCRELRGLLVLVEPSIRVTVPISHKC